jgi:EmrB/QacA subfamily drug resistance transporter
VSSPVDVAVASAPPELTRQQKIFTMVAALLGLLLAALDQTIVSTAGPDIQRDLAIAPSLYAWITTSYLVASTVCVPIYGKLSDLYGRKVILLSGIVIFLTGSALCGIASSALELILYRAVQGIGAASLFTSAFAVVADLFPPQERGKWQGLFGACFGLSSVIGPLLGGFLTDHFGWHWVFFVNLPIGAAAVAFILSKMPDLRREGGPVHLDIAGTVALVVAVVPLLLALSLGRSVVLPGETAYPWFSAPILGGLALSALGGVAFVVAEKRAVDPIVELELFRSKPFALGTLAAFTAGAAFLGAIVFRPLFMVNVVGLSATRSGFTTLPLTFGIVAANVLSGQLVSRMGRYKGLLLGSLGVLLVGFSLLATTLTVDSTQGEVTAKMILLGLGLGPAIPLFTLHLQNAVPPQKVGVATSTSTFARQMGSTVGIALLGSVFGTTFSDTVTEKMAAATEGLPAEMVARFKPGAPQGASGEEGGAPRSFDRAAVEEKVHAAFAAQGQLLERALEKEDAAAMETLAQDPRTPGPLREALAAGGVRQAVAKGFAAQRASVDAAFAAEDPEAALAALAEDARTPAPLAAALRAIPGPTLASPPARGKVLEELHAGQQVALIAAQEAAVKAALEGARQGLQGAEAAALEAVGRVSQALRESFAEAIRGVYTVAIGIAVLAGFVTLLVPEVPLRKGPPGGAPTPVE